uniref:Septin-type G domain-containing protein n=1 Tax=Naja naja TaxID=35670 RepID=A0A8C6XJH3_NAJNA
MLIRTHMQDLKDVTNNVHYENYRSRKLAAVTYNGTDNNKNKGQLTKILESKPKEFDESMDILKFWSLFIVQLSHPIGCIPLIHPICYCSDQVVICCILGSKPIYVGPDLSEEIRKMFASSVKCFFKSHLVWSKRDGSP